MDDSRQIAELTRHRRPREQRANPGDHLPGPLAVLHDGDERLADAVEVGPIGGQPLQTGRRVGDDGRQGLVDLVRDGRGQLAHGRHARHPRELRLGPVQRRLGLRPLDGHRGQVRNAFDDVALVRTGVARLAIVHREGPQHPAVGGQHGSGPARSQRVRQGQLAVVDPQGVGGDVGDDHRLGAAPCRRW